MWKGGFTNSRSLPICCASILRAECDLSYQTNCCHMNHAVRELSIIKYFHHLQILISRLLHRLLELRQHWFRERRTLQLEATCLIIGPVADPGGQGTWPPSISRVLDYDIHTRSGDNLIFCCLSSSPYGVPPGPPLRSYHHKALTDLMVSVVMPVTPCLVETQAAVPLLGLATQSNHETISNGCKNQSWTVDQSSLQCRISSVYQVLIRSTRYCWTSAGALKF